MECFRNEAATAEGDRIVRDMIDDEMDELGGESGKHVGGRVG